MINGGFEWEYAKAARNWRKYDVGFSMARDAFRGGFAIEWIDDASDAREVRYLMLGMVEDRLLTIVFTMRGERIRIISARSATPAESRR